MKLPELLSSTCTKKIWLVIRCLLFNSRYAIVGRTLAFLVLLSSHAVSRPETLDRPTEFAVDPCGYSDQIYAEDAFLRRSPKAPTHFRLMVTRYISMVDAMRGYRCAGTVTVGFDGHHYYQTGIGDDPGLMELVPTLSRLSGLSLSNAYDVTMIVVIGLGLLVGYAGLSKLHPEALPRWIGAAAFVLVGLAEARVADEYIFQVSPLIAGIPWLVYFALTRRPFAFISSAALLAFCCSCCSLARAGTIVVCASLLIAMLLLLEGVPRAIIALLLLTLACVPPLLFQQSLVARRNLALARRGVTATAPDSHVVWATAYIGLGFISNSEVPEYRDGVGAAKVRSIDPSVVYASAQFETIVRNEIWRIVKRKPMIVIENVAAKAGIVTLLGSLLLFPARRFILSESDLLWFDIAFLVTAGVSAINAIVAVPRLAYLLTFTCLCVLYSTIKVCRALAQRKPGDEKVLCI